MKDNILVTSGGFNSINNYVSEENAKLFKERSEGKKVIIIANAAPEGTGNYIARENVKENFLKVGAVQADIVDITDENMECIKDYDVIYMLGGDPTFLVRLCQNPLFKESILKVLENGTYIGESAGSIILSDDVKFIYDLKKGTKPKYDVILDSYKGLGLIDLYIYPHFQKTSDEMKAKVENYEKEHGITITRLNDGEIIFDTFGDTSQKYPERSE